MTLGEFRAWLDGFNSAIVGTPNKEQWALIQEKLATVRPDALTTPYVYPLYQMPHWPSIPYAINCYATGTTIGTYSNDHILTSNGSISKY
jgi:hypothetical protein